MTAKHLALLMFALAAPMADRALAQGLNFGWTPASAAAGLPPYSIRAGTEGAATPVYICRSMMVSGEVLPGKVVGPNCYVPFQGKEVLRADYEVLTGVADERLWNALGMAGGVAFVAGLESGQPAYVCRADLYIGGSLIGREIGKTESGRCWVGWRGEAYPIDSFQVLYTGQAGAVSPIPYTPPQPYAPPAPNPYAPPAPYYPGPAPYAPPAPPPTQGPTSQFMAGYVTFGGACVGRPDEHLIVRMGGDSSEERHVVFHGDNKIHMYVPQGTSAKAACGDWPPAALPFDYKAIDR